MKLELSSAILKATNPTLRTDNWQANIEVCDIVKSDPEDNGKDAVQMLCRRLEQDDANVILRSLSLIVALAENCGSRLQQEISSKAFTSLLYSLIEKRQIHYTVKIEIAKVVRQLAKSFKYDPSLRSMNDIYKKIKKNHSELIISSSSNHPDDSNSKKDNLFNNSKDDTQSKEQNELEEALKLSLQEFESQTKQNKNVESNAPLQKMNDEVQAPKVVKKVRAMYDLNSSEKDELSFKKGDIIIVLEQVYRDWWRGTLHGKIGIFPLNYVTPIVESTIQELQIEKSKENIVFQQYDNVNHLHQTLKNSSQTINGNKDITQDEQINNLYGTVTPLRPQITKMIGKYSREKDDVTSLHQVLAQAEKTYNQLLDQAANAYKPAPTMTYQQQLQSQLQPVGYPQNYGAQMANAYPGYQQPHQQNNEQFYSPAQTQFQHPSQPVGLANAQTQRYQNPQLQPPQQGYQQNNVPTGQYNQMNR
ncbi:similar to Saccharomyces cerevisiae YHL002W HSE1 Subunit of the endosomal Vps27p-Hse1p complex required for sorting of ubiquitinated membrane proteins into intralumenal vesicles prior to vacuolar degradation [Maudiozyma barnettii]|uniref:Class E vacuolar protein-sorting machinery protein HSE1 n=1 Tax=Maudiozyma barnettii TaxID=61262 RepID=A0A8H2ZMK0_9SACH|nr:ESCRT-0 subunit protein HSE1 [Kazachstania barnettii]CAB4257167.1 similar to Saccharomyces cerevisiae YHL002W HSE1 Subunit of the endosomal Vps27p-Hse1p complex required for sorting of ubiquitinated membrane proteins into intralumenal vesicles prior to vacuolar degradation [Kazachstania barnettii]CAD1779537.1 similar to Saccharomyces cerevisiae YHL002W HSE1 Subunit of the endosomal Vps27p-Hse1p complex required for sorting of ubiquitinated membrane proteins into intralumenal vesicles prior to 